MIILLFGLPGSGKGTQGKFLSQTFKMIHVSTGDILRELADKDTNFNYLYSEYLNVGKLVPQEIINKAIKQFIVNNDQNSGIILDGYPRTIDQAEYLVSITNQKIIAFFLEVDRQTIYKRILGRFNCKTCGTIYNFYFKKLKNMNICDNCNSKIFNYRNDDTEKIIDERIEVYHKFTLPVINYYKEKKMLFTLNGNEDIKKLHIELDNLLKMD